MNYYEEKQLQDRESHLIGAGITFVIMSPAFGIIAGAFLASAAALYVVTIVAAGIGVLAIAAGIKEKIERKHQS